MNEIIFEYNPIRNLYLDLFHTDGEKRYSNDFKNIATAFNRKKTSLPPISNEQKQVIIELENDHNVIVDLYVFVYIYMYNNTYIYMYVLYIYTNICKNVRFCLYIYITGYYRIRE
jgi:hypothetical protein